MSQLNNQRQKAQSVFMHSVEWFANFAAVAVAFFGVPIVYAWTNPFIRDFTTRHYGVDVIWVTDIAWFVILSGLVFFSARASLATLLISGGLVVAARLWV